MATEIRVPTLGESVSEATVGKWLKKAGDMVKADEVLLELETDKVSVEVPSPASGVLSEITVQVGDNVAPGGLLGIISEGGAAAVAAPAKAAAPVAAAAPAASVSPAPSAAKMMADSGVSVDSGSGKRGQVLKGDVIEAIAKGASVPAAPVTLTIPTAAPRPASAAQDQVREERVRMSRRYTDNAQAYQLYLQGRFYWNKFNESGFRRAIRSYEEALKLDTNYALAYAGIAEA